VRSRATPRFWAAYRGLPSEVRDAAHKAYALFNHDPSHPSLQFKKVHPEEAIYSVRVTRAYRALGVVEGDEIIWFWIGSHADYDRLLSRL
jgi:hypothetical protein